MKYPTKLLAALALLAAVPAKAAASEPTFPPVDYLEYGHSYVFENRDVTGTLGRYLCQVNYYNQPSLTDHISLESIWTVVGGDSYGGYTLQNAATGSYLFKSDQPWSNSVYTSDKPCTVYISSDSWSYNSPVIKFSLSINGSGNSFLKVEDFSIFSVSNREESGTSWYAYEANPEENIIFTTHKACITTDGNYVLSFVKPVSPNIVFSSSNPQVADVYYYYYYYDRSITGIAAGTTTITATCGNKSDTCSITVLPVDNHFEINNVSYKINRFLDGVTIVDRGNNHNDMISLENLEIPDSIEIEGFSYPVTQIDSYGFWDRYCSLTGSLTLGKNLKFIDSDAFYGDHNISVVVSKSLCPPPTGEYPFGYDLHKKAVLMVPAEAISAYSATEPWSEFKEIRSIEPLTAIAFAEPNVTCPLNGTVQLKIEKTPMYATGDISYTSSNPTVASIDANGIVTGHTLGSTAIIAMSGTLVASCVVNVENPLPPVIPAAALNYKGIIANVGESVAIGAEVLPADVTDPTINWTSSNPQVAAVDADGVVWFNAAGNATVTAECQGLDFSVPFVVKEVMARALNVFPVEAVGGIGHEFSLLALHEPENTTDKSVTWESSNPEVASVSEDGRVQLASLGSAQITARSGEHTAACAVTVDDTVNLTEMASTGVVIDIVEGGIVVRNAPVGESIAAYSVDGKVVNGAMVESDETRLALAPGIYIVKVSPATVAKVLIKL